MSSNARSGAIAATLGTAGTMIEGLRAALFQLIGTKEQRIEADREGASRTLRLVGALDKRIARELKAQAKATAEAEGTHWVIDLSQVDAWDSEGLAALVYALDVSELQGKHLTLLEPSSRLRHTLERSQLHHLFNIAQRDELNR